MAHETEFITADFVTLKVKKTWKMTSFFKKKKRRFLLSWQVFADAEQQIYKYKEAQIKVENTVSTFVKLNITSKLHSSSVKCL